MNDDYLWDRSGAPDPEIEHLEQALSALRYRHRAGLAGQTIERPRRWRAIAAAAALVLAAAGLSRLPAPASPATAWRVDSLAGEARLGTREAAVAMPLGAGQLLATGSDAAVTLSSSSIGRIELGPDSELRAATDRRVRLRRGQLRALIWAPPREFILDTPSARAIDLGCEYTITMNESGDGLLRVHMGWVAFRSGGRESFIPAGAQCATSRRGGPGIPYYGDAPAALTQELGALERGETGALPSLLVAARPRDGLTLWHLLSRVPPQGRAVVYDRLAQLVPLPREVSRAGIERGDARMLDLCWNALNLENTEWWRGWERRWE